MNRRECSTREYKNNSTGQGMSATCFLVYAKAEHTWMLPMSIVNKSRPQVMTRMLKNTSTMWSVGYKALPKELPHTHILRFSQEGNRGYRNRVKSATFPETELWSLETCIPHCHYTPEEWEHNLIYWSVDIADNGNCKCIYSETKIASEGVCSSFEALRVEHGVLSPRHPACVMQWLNPS